MRRKRKKPMGDQHFEDVINGAGQGIHSTIIPYLVGRRAS